MTTRVGVVGLGLMGGSLLRALVETSAGALVASGWDTDAHTRIRAATAGLTVAGSLEDLAAESDVVFVAVPLPELSSVFSAMSGVLESATVVSDLTSVKQPVRDLAAGYGFTYVGGHPMAGTEESGFSASDPDLLAGAAWVLTLDDETDVGAWLAVADLVTSLGCRAVACTSNDHDRAVARVSHLPHIVATALSAAAADDPLALTLAAGSFRDTTRVAATRPELLTAMCGGNSAALDKELTGLIARLQHVLSRLDDPDALSGWFAGAGAVRRAWPATHDTRTEVPVDPQLASRLLAAGRAGGQVTAVTSDHVVLRGPTAGAP